MSLVAPRDIYIYIYTHICIYIYIYIYKVFPSSLPEYFTVPSILHCWIHAVFGAYKFPTVFRILLFTLYAMNDSVTNLLGIQVMLYYTLSGVPQGCPLSGLVFAVCFNPFLVMFSNLQNLNPDKLVIRV